MADNISNNKRIAKNTIMLYLRMFLILFVALYTSRIVLKTLGISDYGIYNVVGGFVAMLAYLNSVLIGSTQRFMSFALGKGDQDLINSTFATANLTHLFMSLIIFIIAETFGLWFVNNHLVIDPERMIAANWVYQCSIVSLIITIISIPYNSCIVAHEHMHIYAYVSILEVILKLVILYLLVIIRGDKLIIYAILHVFISLIIRSCYTIYCRRHFCECRAKPAIDNSLFKKMFSYASWTALGSMGFSFKDQFSNIIMNAFLGTTINAARGIATQVNGAVVSFSTNFFMAISPQITKQYAAGNISQSQRLVYDGARYSFLLLSLITIPVIVNLNYILKVWLEVVPEFTADFLIITLISSLIYSLTNSSSTAIQATGNIKLFQIGVSIIMMMELPAAYLILRSGYDPPYALLPVVFTNSFALVFRFYVLKRLVPSYNYRRYYLDTVFKCFGLFIICFVPSYYFNKVLPDGFMGFAINLFCIILFTLLIFYLFGINKNEQIILQRFVAKKFNIKISH